MSDDVFDRAYAVMKELLAGVPHKHSEIVAEAKRAMALFKVDKSMLGKLVEKYEFNHANIVVQPPTTLVKDANDGFWFEQKKRIIEGRKGEGFFERYAEYLRRCDIPESVISSIKKDAEDTLRHCANPEAGANVNERKKRGLVVGDVQSGKTMNYLGLVNIACDYGYKVILVLAGMTDSLRQQTQGRFDEGFIGAVSNTISTSQIKFVGVGIRPGTNTYHAVTLTNNDYDFLKFIRKTNNATVGDFAKPVVMVVKKNPSVLKEIAEWLLKKAKDAERKSLLIIDDEADNASVNCGKKDKSPTVINNGIRKLFNAFDVATYIGFTATPFANIFINPDDDPSYKDLFPSDFITLLEAPSNYFGANKVFPYDGENTTSKHLRKLDESESGFLPVKHKRGEVHFGHVPQSMREAILSFLIACAVRTARGAEKKHRSMMINISVLNDLQEEIRSKVQEYIDELRKQLRQNIGLSEKEFLMCPNMKLLKNIYEGKSTYEKDSDFFKDVRKKLAWRNLKKHLLGEIEQFEVVVINNTKKGQERFSYEAKKDEGARVIAVGGYVLSRGLTLEGLMVSYFSRNATAYDSLLQMCRWFGYRPGYEDLCRVYISPQNIMNFRAVVDAVADLKLQFMEMKIRDANPENFGLMVRESPESLGLRLLVTSRNKMQHTSRKEFRLNYGGVVADTSKLSDDRKQIEKNKKMVADFVEDVKADGVGWEDVQTPTGKVKRRMLRAVSQARVAELLARLTIPDANTKFDTKCLSEYVKKSSEFPEWDVVVTSGDSKSEERYCGQRLNVRLFRKRPNELIRIGDTNNRISNPAILESGLTAAQMEVVKGNAARRVALKGWGNPNAYVANDYLNVPGRRPLLSIYPIQLRIVDDSPSTEEERVASEVNALGGLLGFSIAFPVTTSSDRVIYRMNKVKERELAKPEEPEEDNEFEDA